MDRLYWESCQPSLPAVPIIRPDRKTTGGNQSELVGHEDRSSIFAVLIRKESLYGKMEECKIKIT